MYTVRLAHESDKQAWNKTVQHPLQTWEWGEFRKQMGIDVVRIIIEEKNNPIQCYQITFHPIPKTPYTVGYFPKGPYPDERMEHELRKIGKEKNALFIQLEPNTYIEEMPPSKHLSLKPAHHPLFTKYSFIVDLTQSEEMILKCMHPKTRYNIRVAQKHGVKVQEDNSDAAFQEYLRLSKATTDRQGFYAHNNRYHETLWNIFRKAGIAHLWTATYNGETLVAWIIFCWKNYLYYPYGASSRNHREVMAPNLILWELIRWGKEHKFEHFDLWGSLGPNPDIHDPWYGFHRFKEGYHPNLVEFVGSYDLVIQPMLYNLYCFADTIRWAILTFKNKPTH